MPTLAAGNSTCRTSFCKRDRLFVHGTLNAELAKILRPKEGPLPALRAALVFHPQSLHLAQRLRLMRIAKWWKCRAVLHCCSPLVCECYHSLSRGYVFQQTLLRVAYVDLKQLTGHPFIRFSNLYCPSWRTPPLSRRKIYFPS